VTRQHESPGPAACGGARQPRGHPAPTQPWSACQAAPFRHTHMQACTHSSCYACTFTYMLSCYACTFTHMQSRDGGSQNSCLQYFKQGGILSREIPLILRIRKLFQTGDQAKCRPCSAATAHMIPSSSPTPRYTPNPTCIVKAGIMYKAAYGQPYVLSGVKLTLNPVQKMVLCFRSCGTSSTSVKHGCSPSHKCRVPCIIGRCHSRV
jgi:hypothetical protein